MGSTERYWGGGGPPPCTPPTPPPGGRRGGGPLSRTPPTPPLGGRGGRGPSPPDPSTPPLRHPAAGGEAALAPNHCNAGVHFDGLALRRSRIWKYLILTCRQVLRMFVVGMRQDSERSRNPFICHCSLCTRPASFLPNHCNAGVHFDGLTLRRSLIWVDTIRACLQVLRMFVVGRR